MPTIDTLWLTLGIVSVTILFWFFFFQNPSTEDLSISFYKGITSLLSKDYDGAIFHFNQINSNDIGFIESRFLLSNIFKIEGRFTDSIAVLNSLLDEHISVESENYIDLLYEKASIYFHAGIYDRSIILLKEIITINPMHRPSLIQLNRLYEVSSEWDKAIEVSRLHEISDGEKGLQLINYQCSIIDQLIEASNIPQSLELLKAAKQSILSFRFKMTELKIFLKNNETLKCLSIIEEVLTKDPTYLHLILEELQKESSLKNIEYLGAIKNIANASKESKLFAIKSLIIFSKNMPKEVRQELFLNIIDFESDLQRQVIAHYLDNQHAEKTLINQAFICKSCNSKSTYHHWQCLTCYSWEELTFRPEVEIDTLFI